MSVALVSTALRSRSQRISRMPPRGRDRRARERPARRAGDAPRRALELRPRDALLAAALGHVAEQFGRGGGVVGERDEGGVLAVVLGKRLGARRRGVGELRETLRQQGGVGEERVVLAAGRAGRA